MFTLMLLQVVTLHSGASILLPIYCVMNDRIESELEDLIRGHLLPILWILIQIVL